MRYRTELILVIFSMVLLISTSFSFVGGGSESNIDTDEEKVRLLVEHTGLDTKELDEDVRYNILEEYDHYLLIEASKEGIEALESRDISLEKLEDQYQVHLQSYSFDTREGEPSIPEELKIEEYCQEEEGHYIIQFIGPIKSEWREKLEEKGVEIHEFRHRFNFIVEMKSETKEEVENLEFVNWIGIYHPAYRFDKELLDRSENLKLEVFTFSTSDETEYDTLSEDMICNNRNALSKGEKNFILEAKPDDLIELANMHQVKHITESVGDYRLLNADATWITQTDEEDNRKVTEKGITGEDELITIMDSELYGGNSLDDDHEMWKDPDGNEVGDDHRKIEAHYVPGDSEGDLNFGNYHGTHVVGTALGDAPPYGEYAVHDGNALGSRLIFQDVGPGGDEIDPPGDMYGDGYEDPYEMGSRIHSNSWGIEDVGYVGLAQESDEFLWDHKDFNIVYAAGNEGPDEYTIEGQAEGKNVISVGSSINDPFQDDVSDFSSRGYAQDGRIKPTLLHIGQWLNSADRSDDGYSSMSGTSMSTPGIAGQIAQVRQYYNEGWHAGGIPDEEEGFNPSNALVRATLINGAVEISGEGAYRNDEGFPNNDQGFGRSKLDRVLHFEDDERKLIAYDSWDEDVALETGESWSMNFEVDDPSQELEVTLAWTDYPGNIGSDENDPAIVNDLDLELNTPDETRYVGNAFTGNDPGYSEPDPTENPWSGLRDSEYDGLNIEENVLLLPDHNGVQEGTYELNIKAHQVPEGPQPFAVVISGGLSEDPPGEAPNININRPEEGEIWRAYEEENIEWETTKGDGDVEHVSLYYRTSKNVDWEKIADNLEDTGEFSWEIPNDNSDEVQIRAEVIDDKTRTGEDVSDKFTIEGESPEPPNNLAVDHAELKEDWHWIYDEEHRKMADTAVGIDEVENWRGAKRTELPGGEITDIAYFHGDEAISVRASIHEDDETEPGEEIGRSYELRNFELDEWHEIPLKESVEIESGKYWVVLEVKDEGDHHFPFGIFDHETEEGTYIKHSGTDGWESRDYTWALETKIREKSEKDNLIKWDSSPEDPQYVSHYNVYRAKESGQIEDHIAEVEAEGLEEYRFLDRDMGMADDNFWYYLVRAVGKNGLEEKNEEYVQEPVRPFQVEIIWHNEEVLGGEEGILEYKVRNIGETFHEQTIIFKIDGEIEKSEEVSINQGESHEGYFTFPLEKIGFRTLQIRSEDHRDYATVSVIEDAYFEVDMVDYDSQILKDEVATYEYLVKNTGGKEASQQVVFEVEKMGDKIHQETEEVSLTPGEIYLGEFEFETEEQDVGDYFIRIKSEDDYVGRGLNILERDAFNINIGRVRRTIAQGDDLLVNYSVINTKDHTDTQNIELQIYKYSDGERGEIIKEDSLNLELESEEIYHGNFTWQTEEDREGDYLIEISSDDQKDETRVEIIQADIFGVEIRITEREIIEGERLEVNFTIINTKNERDSQDIKLEVEPRRNGDVVHEEVMKNLTIDPGETYEGEFIWETEKSDAGFYDLTISSEDDYASTFLQISESGIFEVSMSFPEREPGETDFSLDEDVYVEYQVRNNKEESDTQDILFKIYQDDRSIYHDSESDIMLKEGESYEGSFTWSHEETKVGRYTVKVSSEDHNTSQYIEVIKDDVFLVDIELSGRHQEHDIISGDDVTITYTIRNTKDVIATQDISFYVDENLNEVKEKIELDPGDTYENEFIWEVGELKGERTLSVESEDHSDELTVQVFGGSYFDLEINEPPDKEEFKENFEFDISFTVTNSGDIPDTKTVDLFIDGELIEKWELHIEDGESKNIEYSFETKEGMEEHEITLSSPDDEDSITIIVDMEEDEEQEEDREDDGIDIPGFTLFLLIASIFSAIFFKEMIRK